MNNYSTNYSKSNKRVQPCPSLLSEVNTTGFYTFGIFVLTGMMPSHWSIPQVSVSVGQESDVHTVYPEERYGFIECVTHHFSHALSINVVLVLKFHEFFYERS